MDPPEEEEGSRGEGNINNIKVDGGTRIYKNGMGLRKGREEYEKESG